MGYCLLVVWIETPNPEEECHPENVDFYILEVPTIIHAMYLDYIFAENPPEAFVRTNIRATEIRQIGDWSEAYPPIEEVPIIWFNAERFKAKVLEGFREQGIGDPDAEFEELFGSETENRAENDDL